MSVAMAVVSEALAIKSALLEKVSLGGFNNLEAMIKSKDSMLEIQGILHDIRTLRHSFHYISFSCISPLGNVAADSQPREDFAGVSM